jgi:branched-subunit amino acid aminotransferase/4-amino-4-deoxychorismate lyase
MLQIYYNKEKGGWQSPTIVPFQDLKLSPASAALHYGESFLFECLLTHLLPLLFF